MDKIKGPFWTGVGSRSCPADICALMTRIGEALYEDGYVLRSGGADGADKAFEENVPDDGVVIYRPWGKPGPREALVPASVYVEAEHMVSEVHPRWDLCNATARKLHVRNVCQVLGDDLKTPSKFLIFWAPEDRLTKQVQGGTATAVNLARKHNIPTYNLLFPEVQEKVLRTLFDSSEVARLITSR